MTEQPNYDQKESDFRVKKQHEEDEYRKKEWDKQKQEYKKQHAPRDATSKEVTDTKEKLTLEATVTIIQKRGIVGEEKTIRAVVIIRCGNKVINKKHYSTNLHLEDQSSIGKDHVLSRVLEAIAHGFVIKYDCPTPTAITYSQIKVNKGTKENSKWVTEGKEITEDSIIYIKDGSKSFVNGDDFKLILEEEININKTINQHSCKISCKKAGIFITTTATASHQQIVARLPSIGLDSTDKQTEEIIEGQDNSDCNILEQSKTYTNNHAERLKLREHFNNLKRIVVDLSDVKDYLKGKKPKSNKMVMRRLNARMNDLVKFSTAFHQGDRVTIKQVSGAKWKYKGMFDVKKATKQDVDIGLEIFNNIYYSEFGDNISILNTRQRWIVRYLKENKGIDFTINHIAHLKRCSDVSEETIRTDMKTIVKEVNNVKFTDGYPGTYKYKGRIEVEVPNNIEA
jgi:hypothetical protein